MVSSLILSAVAVPVNIDKTKGVIFNKAGRLVNSQSYSIFNKTISCSTTFSILVYYLSNFTIN